MPRPRKIAAEQSKHLTAVEKAKKERETELALGDATLIRRPPKKLLLDDAAAEKWKYVVRVNELKRRSAMPTLTTWLCTAMRGLIT